MNYVPECILFVCCELLSFAQREGIDLVVGISVCAWFTGARLGRESHGAAPCLHIQTQRPGLDTWVRKGVCHLLHGNSTADCYGRSTLERKQKTYKQIKGYFFFSHNSIIF